MANDVVCILEAARDLGLTRQTVSEVAQKIGVRFKPFPRTRNGKGLSLADVEIIRTRMKPIDSAPLSVPA